MPEMIDGVPACYGCIPVGVICLQCDHSKVCVEYAAKLKKDWLALMTQRKRYTVIKAPRRRR